MTRRLRPAWAEVDLGAIGHNVATITSIVGGADVCAVVKADGYGHGAIEVSRAALSAGASWLAVALVEEGLLLRDAGIEAPILLLSEPPSDAVDEVVHRHLTPTVYTQGGIASLATAAAGAGATCGVHLKVDTGMHRVGAPPADAVTLARLVVASAGLRLDAVWTHLAVADETEPAAVAYTASQEERFALACAAIEGAGIAVPLRHSANSAGALYCGRFHGLVRPGLAVYGYNPDPTRRVADLRPALSLKAQVSHTKVLDAGERLSYGLRYRLGERSLVATVPLGYADGVPRRLSGAGADVLIGGRRHPISGTVTMDQILVDCGPASTAAVAVGDEVVLLGSQGNERITADDWAIALGTISYEILCGIGARVPRVHVT